jgi:hypothetical protein
MCGAAADTRRRVARASKLTPTCSTLLRLSLLLGALPGVRPGGRVTFFCGARRKSPKKRP